MKVALGIHPANSNINPELIYENLYNWIENKQITAIGEIGLEDLTDSEISIFKRQLEIADILPEHLDERNAVIDHVNQNIVDNVIGTDCTLGLTVQPQKMDKHEAVTILNEYGFDRFLLNSDISNKPSDPLSVPKTVRELKRLDFNDNDIEKVAFKNARNYFNI